MSDDDERRLSSSTPFKPGDSIFDAFQPVEDMWVEGADGLPEPVDTDASPAPPPMTPETLVCLAQQVDKRPLPSWLESQRARLVRVARSLGRHRLADSLVGRIPTCKHYARMLTPLGEFRDQRQIERWCLHPGLKTLSGGGMQLSDSAVFACELRDLVSPRCSEILDEIDDKKLEASRVGKRYWRLFRTAA